jgi:hypothetical protein
MVSRSQPSGDAKSAATDVQPSAAERLTEALAEYDAHVAKCPVNNFLVDRRTYGPNDRCSACGSVASGGCGKEATASYRLVQQVRALAKAAGC